MRMWSWMALGALFATLTACGPADVCNEGETRACYTGPAGTKGVGLCREGAQTCSNGQWSGACEGEVKPVAETCDTADNDCDGTNDNGVQNACGGCNALEAQPDEACEDCGTFACDGTEAVSCTTPSQVGQTCVADNGCEGAWACGPNGITCEAPAKNACGVCGGPVISDKDDACTADGCAGTRVCNPDGTATVCQAPAKNACGVCGGPVLPGLGDACQGANGCSGTNVCNKDGSGVSCEAPAKNACGVCGGPAITGLGDACGGSGGVCAGTLVCNTAGTGTTCDGPAPNNCGKCGEPDVENVGSACSADDCDTTFTCNAEGTAAVCVAAPKNACGVCGGPAVTGLGDACQTSDGCDGTKACNSAGTAAVCNAPAKNACGVCGGPVVTGVGASCTGANGCTGKNVCNEDGSGVTCEAPEKNACDVCGGPAVTGIGDACENAEGCAGVYACDSAGGKVCNAPTTCSTRVCGGQPFTDAGTVCTATNGTRGIKECVGGAVVCKGADAGGARVVISEISITDKYVELYNASNAPIDINGYTLYYRSNNSTSTWGNTQVMIQIPSSTVLPAGSYYLLAASTYSGTGTAAKDRAFTWASPQFSSSGGQFWLMNQKMTTGTPSLTDPQIVDMVGFGTSNKYEGSGAAPAAPSGQVIERKAYASSTATTMSGTGADADRGNAQDSNDNKADFFIRPTKDPQNSQSFQEP